MWRKEASKQKFLGNTRSYFISLTSSTGHRVLGVYKNMKEHFHEQGENSFASVIKSDLSQIFLTVVQLLFEECVKERICYDVDRSYPCLLSLRNIQHCLVMSEGKSTLDFHTRETKVKRFLHFPSFVQTSKCITVLWNLVTNFVNWA